MRNLLKGNALSIAWCLVTLLFATKAAMNWTPTAGNVYSSEQVKSFDPICGPSSIVNICALRGVDVHMSDVLKRLKYTKQEVSLTECARVISDLGLPADLRRFDRTDELPQGVPFLLPVRVNGGNHAVVALRSGSNAIIIDGRNIRHETTSYLNSVALGLAVVPRK